MRPTGHPQRSRAGPSAAGRRRRSRPRSSSGDAPRDSSMTVSVSVVMGWKLRVSPGAILRAKIPRVSSDATNAASSLERPTRSALTSSFCWTGPLKSITVHACGCPASRSAAALPASHDAASRTTGLPANAVPRHRVECAIFGSTATVRGEAQVESNWLADLLPRLGGTRLGLRKRPAGSADILHT